MVDASVTYTIQRPSGLHAGERSLPGAPVSRRGAMALPASAPPPVGAASRSAGTGTTHTSVFTVVSGSASRLLTNASMRPSGLQTGEESS